MNRKDEQDPRDSTEAGAAPESSTGFGASRAAEWARLDSGDSGVGSESINPGQMSSRDHHANRDNSGQQVTPVSRTDSDAIHSVDWAQMDASDRAAWIARGHGVSLDQFRNDVASVRFRTNFIENSSKRADATGRVDFHG